MSNQRHSVEEEYQVHCQCDHVDELFPLIYQQPGDHVFVLGSQSERRRHAIFIQYDWKMLGRKVIQMCWTGTTMQLTILYREKEKKQSSEVIYGSLKEAEDRETRWHGGWGIYRGTVKGEVSRIFGVLLTNNPQLQKVEFVMECDIEMLTADM